MGGFVGNLDEMRRRLESVGVDVSTTVDESRAMQNRAGITPDKSAVEGFVAAIDEAMSVSKKAALEALTGASDNPAATSLADRLEAIKESYTPEQLKNMRVVENPYLPEEFKAALEAEELSDELIAVIRYAAASGDMDGWVALCPYIDGVMSQIQRERKEKAELSEILEGHIIALDMADRASHSVFHRLKRVLAEYGRLHRQVQDIKKVMGEFEEEQKHGFGGYPLSQSLKMMFRHMSGKVSSAERLYKSLREDMQVWTRALGIVATSIGNAGTHREKDARLRGMVEIIESATGSIRESRDQDSVHWLQVPDIFASDYPVREYKQRIYELENEIKRMKQPAGDGSADADDYDDIPL